MEPHATVRLSKASMNPTVGVGVKSGATEEGSRSWLWHPDPVVSR